MFTIFAAFPRLESNSNLPAIRVIAEVVITLHSSTRTRRTTGHLRHPLRMRFLLSHVFFQRTLRTLIEQKCVVVHYAVILDIPESGFQFLDHARVG